MTTTTQELAAHYAALPESIRERCPRPTGDVTPNRVRAWLVQTRDTCLAAASSTMNDAVKTAGRGDLQGAVVQKDLAQALLAFAAHVGDLIGYPARPTPYDTGTRLEPKPWVKEGITGEDHPRPAEVDDYGRVDFDDDTGFTVATVHIEAEPASAEEVYVMKLSANAPIIIHGPGGEYIATIQPNCPHPNSTVTTVRAKRK